MNRDVLVSLKKKQSVFFLNVYLFFFLSIRDKPGNWEVEGRKKKRKGN